MPKKTARPDRALAIRKRTEAEVVKRVETARNTEWVARSQRSDSVATLNGVLSLIRIAEQTGSFRSLESETIDILAVRAAASA